MIAIFTHRRAVEADRVIRLLADRGHGPVRVNTGHAEATAAVELGADGRLIRAVAFCDGRRIDAEEIAAAWMHQLPPFGRATSRTTAADVAAESSRLRLWESYADVVPYALWLSPPRALARAGNKMFQYASVGAAGLAVPATIAANSPATIRRHVRDGAVMKYLGDSAPLWSVGRDGFAAVTTVAALDTLSDDALTAAPALFQRVVESTQEIRAVAIRNGDRGHVFAAGGSKSPGVTDIRLDNDALRAFRPTQLPRAIEAALIMAMGRMEVGFCSADLLLDAEGTYWFVDLNASGAWWWIDDLFHGEVASALAERLVVSA